MAVVENWEETPTLPDLVGVIFKYLIITFRDLVLESQPQAKPFSRNISTNDIVLLVATTAVVSSLRNILDKHVSMPISKYLDIPEKSRKKIPENAWVFTFFLFVWIYEWYLVLLGGKYRFFEKPETMWDGWSLETFPQIDIYFLYIVQSAFYLHGTYATLFLDTWKTDTVLLTFHHIMALCLLFLSYATRCHNVGLLLVFHDDSTHVFVGLYKLCFHFKTQERKDKKWIEMMGKVGFAVYLLMWFIFRLYWFPIKVLYATAIHIQRLELNIPYIFWMYLMLFIHLILNIYWGMGILKTSSDIFSGQKLKDTRDID